VTSRDEDEVWRSIVENYGEPADLGDLDRSEPEVATTAPRPVDPPARAPDDEPRRAAYDDEDRFVPPTPPPIPRPHGWRAAAWTGLFGSPLLMLACVVFSIDLPGILDLALVAGFVGGFVYLIASLPRGPRDPWDDGSRV
jgi:hypothetical protein